MRVLSDIPRRVLCVFAHPDDADIGAGGTIARWAAGGAEITLVIVARGDKGTLNPELDPESLVETRRNELDSASSHLGVSTVQNLGLGDGEIANDWALRRSLVQIIRSFKPDVVLSHDPTAIYFGSTYFNHRDHRELGFALLDSVFPASHLPHYFPDAGPAHRVALVLLSGTMDPQVAVDISTSIAAKKKAVCCHESQVGTRATQVEASIENTARSFGRRAGVMAAEVFRELRNEMGSR